MAQDIVPTSRQTIVFSHIKTNLWGYNGRLGQVQLLWMVFYIMVFEQCDAVLAHTWINTFLLIIFDLKNEAVQLRVYQVLHVLNERKNRSASDRLSKMYKILIKVYANIKFFYVIEQNYYKTEITVGCVLLTSTIICIFSNQW